MSETPLSFGVLIERAHTDMTLEFGRAISAQSSGLSVNYWDWPAGNAALAGGIVSGVAAGVMAYLVFWLGVKRDRKERKDALEQQEADAAFETFVKLTQWLSYGAVAAQNFLSHKERYSEEIERDTPFGLFVLPSVGALPEPERIEVSGVSFLVHREKAELVNTLFEIQNWAYHLAALAKEYLEQRAQWDSWAPNAATHNGQDVEAGVHSEFGGTAQLQARIRERKLTTLANGICEVGATQDVYFAALEEFCRECQSEFGHKFPDVAPSTSEALQSASKAH